MTVVAHGNTRPAGRDSDALLHQLSQLSHSLPLIPESVESSGTWSKALQRGSSAAVTGASSSAPPLPRLDCGPLEDVVADYQRFSRWHCRRIVAKQEELNAAIPRVEQQAVRLQRRLADAATAAAAERAAEAAVADVQAEVEAVAARLARLQQLLGEVEREVAQQTGVSSSAQT